MPTCMHTHTHTCTFLLCAWILVLTVVRERTALVDFSSQTSPLAQVCLPAGILLLLLWQIKEKPVLTHLAWSSIIHQMDYGKVHRLFIFPWEGTLPCGAATASALSHALSWEPQPQNWSYQTRGVWIKMFTMVLTHNSSKLETTQMSINTWANKQSSMFILWITAQLQRGELLRCATQRVEVKKSMSNSRIPFTEVLEQQHSSLVMKRQCAVCIWSGGRVDWKLALSLEMKVLDLVLGVGYTSSLYSCQTTLSFETVCYCM